MKRVHEFLRFCIARSVVGSVELRRQSSATQILITRRLLPAPMKFTAVDIIPYRIPNRELHRIATLTLSALDNVIVRIHTDAGIGA
jgi:hypothetical protein